MSTFTTNQLPDNCANVTSAPPETVLNSVTAADPSGNDGVSKHAVAMLARIGKRRKTHVNTLSERMKATQWIIAYANENDEKHIASKCVRHFPEFFPGNEESSIQKASRWWKSRMITSSLTVPGKRIGNFTFSSTRSRKRANLKAMAGQGRERAEWVESLYIDLRSDFEWLRAAGVKFDTSMLQTHALMMVMEAEHGSKYHESIVYNGKPIAQYITKR